MTHRERRQAARINTLFIFNYKRITPEEYESARNQLCQANATRLPPFPSISPRQIPTNINISANGMSFATQGYFVVNDAIAISLMINRSGAPLRLIARVIEFIQDPEGSTGYVRLNFEEMTQYDRLQLANFIIRRMTVQKDASS